MAANEAICSGQPRASFEVPSNATWSVAHNGYWTATRIRHGSARTQVSCEQSLTSGRSSCQPVGSPTRLPIMNPITGQPIRIDKIKPTA